MNPTSNHNGQWYYQHHGEVVGPVSKQVLLKLLKSGVVKPDSLIKSDTDDIWVHTETVGELSPDAHSEKSTDASSAAAQLLSNTHNRGFRVASEEDDSESLWNKFAFSEIKSNLSRWVDVPSSLAEFLVEKLSILKYGFKLWVILPLLLLLVSGLCIKFFAIDWYHQRIAFETYSSIWEDLQRLRAMELEDHQWDSFKTETQSKIANINSSIEKTATIQDPYSMELLRAGRDYLPRMLDDARNAPSVSEKKFAVHMSKAAQYRRLQSQKTDSMNTIGFLIIIVDICLVSWGILLLVRKFRS